ncbi:hypothetical protein ACO0K8_00400 [Undibacterium sp. Ren11W]
MKLSERSEFASFPILRLAQLGIPQGQRLCVAFFGIPFLAKQKRYVVAGLPPASNRTTTTEVKTRPDNKNTTKPTRISHAPRRPACLKKRMAYARWQAAILDSLKEKSARLRCANRAYVINPVRWRSQCKKKLAITGA